MRVDRAHELHAYGIKFFEGDSSFRHPMGKDNGSIGERNLPNASYIAAPIGKEHSTRGDNPGHRLRAPV
jgi:hypothetical protein